MKKFTFIFWLMFTAAFAGAQIDQGNRLIKGKLDVRGLSTLGTATSTQFSADNLRLDGNTLSTLNTNGDFTIDLNGTGSTIFADLTASTVPYLDASKKLKSSTTTDTQLGYLGNATSNICGISQACTLSNKTLTAPTINGATLTGGIGLGVSYASKILVGDSFGNLAASIASSAEAAQLVGVTSSICGISQVCTQTNKTFTAPIIDAITLDDQASTPASPSSGFYKIYAKTDGKMYLLNNLGAESAIGSGGVGGSGGINYVSNPDAVTDALGWTTYDDSSATLVDGTGGTFDSTFTRTATAGEQVRENSIPSGTFKFSKGAANRQGEGVCWPFTIDRIDKIGKTQKVSFDYWTTTNYVDDDAYVAVYAYGTTPAVYPVRNSNGGFVKSALNGASAGNFEAFFEPDGINSSYRVCVHIRTVNANAYDILWDNFQFGPAKTYATPNLTDWKSYTPVLTTTGTAAAFGTIVRNTMWYRQVGDSIQMHWDFKQSAPGTAGTGAYLISLPPGMTADATKRVVATNPAEGLMGDATWYNSGITQYFQGQAQFYDATRFTFQFVNPTGGAGTLLGWGAGDLPLNFSGTTTISATGITIPIVGLTSGNVFSADAFNSQFPSPLTTTSGVKSPAASGQWQAHTNNSIVLTQGTWRLFGSCVLGNNGSVPGYTYSVCSWAAGNGADSGSAPTALSSVTSVKTTQGSGDTNYTSAIGSTMTVPAQDITVTCLTATCTVYLNTFTQMTTAANARITVYGNAQKIPDYTVYGNVNKPPKRTVYTAGGTHTVAPGTRYIEYTVIGGGGDGGGSVVNGSGTGGGAGGMSQGQLNTFPASLTIVVGSRGAPGTASSISGTGITTITANGGTNGVCCNTSGAAGGGASGGDVNTTGQYGSNSYYAASDFDPGDGGSTIFPGGGRGAGTGIGVSGTQTATGYGNGGGGSANGAGGGGPGTNGIVILTEYF